MLTEITALQGTLAKNTAAIMVMKSDCWTPAMSLRGGMNGLLGTWWKGGGDRRASPVLVEGRGKIIQVNRYSRSGQMCSRPTEQLMQRS